VSGRGRAAAGWLLAAGLFGGSALVSGPVLVGGALLVGGCVDSTVTARPVKKDLKVEEIRAGLRSKSFREKLAAKKQIGKLAPADRLRVLQALAQDPDAPTRTIAVQELGKMLPDPGAHATLQQVAKNDASPDLRQLAAEKLEKK